MQSKGLKAMRKVKGSKPTHKCDNCGCVRYSPCTCQKAVGVVQEAPVQTPEPVAATT